MAKPVLYYALARSRYGYGFRVLAVTLEKGGQVYGREIDTSAATHVSARDVLHRFPEGTPDFVAGGASARAEAARKLLQPTVNAARAALAKAEAQLNAAVLAAAKAI